uniref:Uncharacterized protein n=1 Tax=Glossina pallidipes TaxID=7398 RepID=A0A1A9ZT45_GLOPL
MITVNNGFRGVFAVSGGNMPYGNKPTVVDTITNMWPQNNANINFFANVLIVYSVIGDITASVLRKRINRVHKFVKQCDMSQAKIKFGAAEEDFSGVVLLQSNRLIIFVLLLSTQLKGCREEGFVALQA